jgi:hypothetical protein
MPFGAAGSSFLIGRVSARDNAHGQATGRLEKAFVNANQTMTLTPLFPLDRSPVSPSSLGHLLLATKNGRPGNAVTPAEEG